MYPFLINKMFSNFTGYAKRSKANQLILNYLMEIVTKHEAELDPNNPKDFIDVYFDEIKSQSTKQE